MAGKKKMLKAQGSTEYLVVLAIVLVIAVIVIALLGGFAGFAPSTLVEQSQNYWQGTSPFSIEGSNALSENQTQ